MQCEKKKRDGSDCGARALKDNHFCSLHAQEGRAAELGRRGGRRRATYPLKTLREFDPPTDASDLKTIIAQAMIEVRTGELDPRLANTIAYLGSSFLRALEVSALEDRLKKLETMTGTTHVNH